MKVLYSSPGLEDLWQIHFSQLSGQEYTVPGMFIANLTDEPLSAMPVAPIATPHERQPLLSLPEMPVAVAQAIRDAARTQALPVAALTAN